VESRRSPNPSRKWTASRRPTNAASAEQSASASEEMSANARLRQAPAVLIPANAPPGKTPLTLPRTAPPGNRLPSRAPKD